MKFEIIPIRMITKIYVNTTLYIKNQRPITSNLNIITTLNNIIEVNILNNSLYIKLYFIIKLLL